MEEKKSKRKTGAERKLEILRALVSLISESESKHITTKTLAHRLGISEAALYRHFPGKAEMYREVIKYAENFIVSWINKIVSENASGSDQVKTLYKLLLSLRSAEPGLISLLCGEALALEDKSLQQNINKIYGYIQIAFKQSLKLAAAQGEIFASADAAERASFLLSLLLGHWLRFIKQDPSEKDAYTDSELALVLAG